MEHKIQQVLPVVAKNQADEISQRFAERSRGQVAQGADFLFDRKYRGLQCFMQGTVLPVQFCKLLYFTIDFGVLAPFGRIVCQSLCISP